MSENQTPPRRRKLPVLGMGTVGLAVGAGSIGLYTGGATAEPIKPMIATQQTGDPLNWTATEVKSPAIVVLTAAETPVTTALAIPMLPALPTLASAEPPAPVPPTQWPPLPKPVETPAPMLSPSNIVPVVTAPPVIPTLPTLSEMAPAKPVMPTIQSVMPPSLGPVIPAEVLPSPREHTAPSALTHRVEVPTPAQPAQSPRPAASGILAPSEFNLPSAQPGFNVNLMPTPVKGVPAKLTSTSLANEPPGDAAMIPSFQSVRAAALGVALAMSPVNAFAAPEKMPLADDAKDKADAAKSDPVALLKAEIAKLREDVTLEKQFREITSDLIQGKKDKETGKTEKGLLTRYEEIEKRLQTIEKSLEKFDLTKFEEAMGKLLDAKLADLNKTTVLKPEATKDVALKAMAGPKATIRIVNEYPVSISMIVNGASVRVEPSQSKSVEIPAGSYSYELLHAGSQPTTATIKESDSITLRIK